LVAIVLTTTLLPAMLTSLATVLLVLAGVTAPLLAALRLATLVLPTLLLVMATLMLVTLLLVHEILLRRELARVGKRVGCPGVPKFY